MKTLNVALFTSLGLGIIGLACSSTPAPGTGTNGTSGAATGTGGSATGTGGSGTTAGTSPGTGGTNVVGTSGATSGGTAQGTGGTAVATAGSTGTGGTAATGGGPAVAEPELVTSGKDNYWKVGTLTKGGTTATVTVTTATKKQPWDGWGGTFNEKGAQMLNGLDAAKKAEVIKKLFDVTDGIGFTWGRIPIGPSDYAIDRYSFQDSATATFSIEHDKTAGPNSKAPMMPFIKDAMAVKPDMKFWGSAWTPPPWMKENAVADGLGKGYDKGSMINTPENLTAYAGYLVNWIKAYEAEGIKINFIVPQNEPGWAQAYPSCAWGSYYDGSTPHNGTTYLGDFVKNQLTTAMKAANLTTDIWYGTFSNKDTFTDYWTNLPSDKTLVKGVALQWATDEDVQKAKDAGFKVMQSEHRCGNYPWLDAKATSEADSTRDNFLADHAPNNHAYGEESWDLIKGWIDKGVNSYSAWNLVLDKGGFNLDKSRPWPQDALIVVDGTTVKYTAAYYVFRHLAEYVDVGSTVVGVTGGSALAWKNPDGAVVTVMYNSGAADSATVLSIDGTMFTVTIPAHGWATVNYKG